MSMRERLGLASIMLAIFWLETELECLLEAAKERMTDFLRLALNRSTSACVCNTSVSVGTYTRVSCWRAATSRQYLPLSNSQLFSSSIISLAHSNSSAIALQLSMKLLSQTIFSKWRSEILLMTFSTVMPQHWQNSTFSSHFYPSSRSPSVTSPLVLPSPNSLLDLARLSPPPIKFIILSTPQLSKAKKSQGSLINQLEARGRLFCWFARLLIKEICTPIIDWLRMDENENRNVHIAQQYKMRFYEDEFPAEGELVMGQSEKSEENGCYVALLEYNGRNGMMPINEYTTTMRKFIHRAMKVGKKEILRVIRVDREKGYIDLSKKQVNVDDEEEGLRKYNNSTQLHSIMIHIAELCKVPILSLYQKYIWPLYKTGKYDHPLTFLKQMLVYEEKQQELGIEDEKIKKCLLDELRRRFKRPIIKTMANFSVSCRSIKGITAIKRALHAGIDAAKEKGFEVKIFIIGAPKYTCEVSSDTVESGREALNHALQAVEKVMKEERGDYSLDKQPYVVGDTSQHIKDMIKGEQVQQVVDDDDSDMGDADD